MLFSKSPNPNWDIDRLPRGQYAPRTPAQIKAETRRGRELRPSGYDINAPAFAKREKGPLPSNLIVAGGASGSDTYSRNCRKTGVEAHPARFPEELPRRIITLTTEPGDIVYDPMAGSNTTGKVALELGRKFIASDPMLSYVDSSSLRFSDRPDFKRHFEI